MSDGTHLSIPFAVAGDEGCRRALESLPLPHLERLLARLAPAELEAGDPHQLSMPHERVLARECRLGGADGLLPLAAWALLQDGGQPAGEAWAWVTPCHWQVGTNRVFMHAPQDLQLQAAESQALLAAMQPYFEQDGIQLTYQAPARWLARGEWFGGLPCASLDRVAGQVVDPWMPRGDAGKALRRLQQEMQMLLYTHPVNEERGAAGRLPVNSFWVSGNGALPAGTPPAAPPGWRVVDALREPALRQDWAAWASGWQELDAGECAHLCRMLDEGSTVALSLSGSRQARTWRATGAGWGRRIAAAFSRRSVAQQLSEL